MHTRVGANPYPDTLRARFAGSTDQDRGPEAVRQLRPGSAARWLLLASREALYVLAMREITSVCVFCGSSSGNEDRDVDAARSVGRLLADNDIRLVYGGGAVGLMGRLADSALEAGGEVVGVIPRGLFTREVAHRGVTSLLEVASMHERKQKMFDLADAFVALPGGLGTLEELCEIATWAQLGIHDKPIATFDASGFWRPLRALLAHAVEREFMKSENMGLIVHVERLAELLPTLRSYQMPYEEKWIGLSEV
jgi:uncharacterized protein (TIGR00730 family)